MEVDAALVMLVINLAAEFSRLFSVLLESVMHMLSANVVVGRSTSISGLPVGRWYHGWLNLRWLWSMSYRPGLLSPTICFGACGFNAWECSFRHQAT